MTLIIIKRGSSCTTLVTNVKEWAILLEGMKCLRKAS
ncbi:unnamed protein product [Rhodiola kirilowii]